MNIFQSTKSGRISLFCINSGAMCDVYCTMNIKTFTGADTDINIQIRESLAIHFSSWSSANFAFLN